MRDDLRQQQITQARQALLADGLELTDALVGAWYDRAWIMQSWRRCLAHGQQPDQPVVFEQLSPHARSHAAEAHHALLAAARPELQRLAQAVAPIRYFAILTDAAGTVIDTAGAIDHADRPVHAIARVGVDLSERSIGTSAIGAALGEQVPVWLHRGEHFYRDTSVYSCAGAPLFGPGGQCVGMLDLTGVQVPERPELKHLVAQSARWIEDALAVAVPHRLRLHLAWPAGWRLSGGDGDGGLLCLDAEGGVASANGAARQMLPALHALGQGAVHASDLFALPWPTLFDLARRGEASLVPLWSGLRLRVRAELAAQAAQPGAARAATEGGPPPRPLRALETELIHQAVREAGGNVAQAARALGLSRATVYRRLAAPHGPHSRAGRGTTDARSAG
jgi:transcriptional regulator of acetoin/glycerol metabolism